MRLVAFTLVIATLLLAVPPLAVAQWTWTGEATGNEWHDCSQIPGSDPPQYVNNWGVTGSTCPLGVPGSTDTAYIAMADGPPFVNQQTPVGHLYVQPGAALEVSGDLRPTWTLHAGGNVALGHDGLLWGCTVETTGTGAVYSIRPNNSVLAVPVLRDVTILGEVTASGGNVLGLDGTITNNGTISLVAGYAALTADTTLAGAGLVAMDGGYFGGVGSAGAYRLTNYDNTVSGSGHLGCGGTAGTTTQIAVTNHGIIDASAVTPLVMCAAPSPTGGGYSVVNDGTLRASQGGTLELNPSTYDNTGGVVEALDGSAVLLSNDVVVFGGTLQTAGTGAIRSDHPSGSSYADPTLLDLTTTGLLEIPDGMLLQVQGAITNHGSISLLGGGDSVLFIGADTTLTGSGVVAMSDATTNRITGTGSPANRLSSSLTIRGSGNVGYTSLALTNDGLVVADQPTPLELRPALSAADARAPVVNHGTLRATSGATLRLYGDASYDNAGGTVEALDGSVVELAEGAWISGGTFDTAGSGVIRAVTTYWRRAWVGEVTNRGRLEIPYGKELWMAGTITNHGTVDNAWRLYPDGDLTLAGSGELVLGDDAQISTDSDDTLTNLTGHTVRATGTSLSRVYTPFTNHGRLQVDASKQLVMQATMTYSPQTGSTTWVDGTLTLWNEITVAGTLGGSGTVDGGVVLGPNGRLSPGNGTGTLTTGPLTIENGAQYDWGVNVLGADLVDVNGVLNFGSATLTVNIHVGSGTLPAQVTLFEYNSLPVAPDMSQILLSGGYSYSGISTADNRLTLTGVSVTGFLFADDLETGDPSRWSGSVPSVKAMTYTFDQPASWVRARYRLGQTTLGAVAHPTAMATALAEDGTAIFAGEERPTSGRLEIRLWGPLTGEAEWSPLPDRGAELEVAWDRAAAAVTLYADGSQLDALAVPFRGRCEPAHPLRGRRGAGGTGCNPRPFAASRNWRRGRCSPLTWLQPRQVCS